MRLYEFARKGRGWCWYEGIIAEAEVGVGGTEECDGNGNDEVDEVDEDGEGGVIRRLGADVGVGIDVVTVF